MGPLGAYCFFIRFGTGFVRPVSGYIRPVKGLGIAHTEYRVGNSNITHPRKTSKRHRERAFEISPIRFTENYAI